MIARDAVSLIREKGRQRPVRVIEGGVHLLEALPQLLDSPGRELSVTYNGEDMGVIDQTSMLDALSRQIAVRDDSCIIELYCAPADYSASLIARAVEDSDVHLVDLLTNPADNGMLRVTLRVRCEDPEATVHSLERHGFDVADVYSHPSQARTAAFERLLAVRTLINV